MSEKFTKMLIKSGDAPVLSCNNLTDSITDEISELRKELQIYKDKTQKINKAYRWKHQRKK